MFTAWRKPTRPSRITGGKTALGLWRLALGFIESGLAKSLRAKSEKLVWILEPQKE